VDNTKCCPEKLRGSHDCKPRKPRQTSAIACRAQRTITSGVESNPRLLWSSSPTFSTKNRPQRFIFTRFIRFFLKLHSISVFVWSTPGISSMPKSSNKRSKSRHVVQTNFVSNPLGYRSTPTTRKMTQTQQFELRQNLMREQHDALQGANSPVYLHSSISLSTSRYLSSSL